jgi:hypothetical protein
MLNRFYLLLFFALVNFHLFSQIDSLKSTSVYFFHQDKNILNLRFPFKGYFKINGEKFILNFNSYKIKKYTAGDEIVVETKTLFKKRKKTFLLDRQKSYYFKCTPVMSWWGKSNLQLKMVEDSTGQKAIKEIIEIEKEDEG